MPRSLNVCGKRAGLVLKAASAFGPTTSRLFHITDHANKVRYLIDTGAEVRVIPTTLEDCRQRLTTPPVTAIKSTNIQTYGHKSVTFGIGLRRTFRWIFMIANICLPISGWWLTSAVAVSLVQRPTYRFKGSHSVRHPCFLYKHIPKSPHRGLHFSKSFQISSMCLLSKTQCRTLPRCGTGAQYSARYTYSRRTANYL